MWHVDVARLDLRAGRISSNDFTARRLDRNLSADFMLQHLDHGTTIGLILYEFPVGSWPFGA